jgi:hypothetical protein
MVEDLPSMRDARGSIHSTQKKKFRKESLLPAATQINLKAITLSEISLLQKRQNCVTPYIFCS